MQTRAALGVFPTRGIQKISERHSTDWVLIDKQNTELKVKRYTITAFVCIKYTRRLSSKGDETCTLADLMLMNNNTVHYNPAYQHTAVRNQLMGHLQSV